MLRLLAKTLLGLILFAGYVAAPFWTAWSIREAMLSGDSQYLERAIDWDNVRETLRQSLIRTALDLPTPAEVSVAETMTAAAPSARPGLWQRLKTYVGTAAVNRAVDRYANARDLPKLFEYRKVYRSYVSDTPEPPKTFANLPERVAKFWSRVKRAEFIGVTQFALQIEDKHTPSRHYTGLLKLTDWRWKLVELHVHAPDERIALLKRPREPQER
jgi:hypothetical protein